MHIDTSKKPTMKALSFLLRHRELWPSDFVWDYMYHQTCAYGLMLRHWDIKDNSEELVTESAARTLGISQSSACWIFIYGGDKLMERVQPEDVAALLDEVANNG
jgi:hypothetical protein